MKQINYYGNLKKDIDRVKNKIDFTDKKNLFYLIGVPVSIGIMLTSLFFLTGTLTLNMLLIISSFVLSDISFRGLILHKELCKIRAADLRLRFLLRWLEHNNIFIKKKELLRATKLIEEVELDISSCVNKEDNAIQDFEKGIEQEQVEYFSFLDENNRRQILKAVTKPSDGDFKYKYSENSGPQYLKNDLYELYLLEYLDILGLNKEGIYLQNKTRRRKKSTDNKK